jgi:hypothetical protein
MAPFFCGAGIHDPNDNRPPAEPMRPTTSLLHASRFSRWLLPVATDGDFPQRSPDHPLDTHESHKEDSSMLHSSPMRLMSALILACTLSACGGGNDGGGFFGGLPGAGMPPPATPPADTGVKPEMRCAP